MKKIIAVMVIIYMLMSVFIVSADAECFYDIYGAGSTSLSVLSDLSFLPEEEPVADEITSKADFCAMFAKAAGICNISDKVFKDVPSDHPAAIAISSTASAGLIKGAGNGYFFPDEPMKVGDMLEAVSALIYDGEYISRLKSLSKLGVTEGLDMSKKYFTNEETATLILQMLKSQSYVITEIAQGYSEKVLTDETLMERIHSICEREGVLESVVFAAGQNTATIDGVTYKYAPEQAYINFLKGKNVTAYTLENDTDNRILYIEENSEECETIKVLSEDVTFTKNYATYYAGDKKRGIRILKNPSVYINGEQVLSYSWNSLNTKDGWTELVDCDKNKTVDSILIYRPENTVVSSVNAGKKTIEDFYQKNSLDLSDSEVSYSIFDKSGKIIGLSDIKKRDVLSIIADKDKKNIIIIRSSDNISGVVDEVGEDYCSINGKSVSVANALLSSEDFGITVGTEGIFYIDFLGNIIASRLSVLEKSYGILLGVAKSDGLTPKVAIKVFSDKGKIETIEAADSLKINGKREKDPEKAYDILTSHNLHQLIRYKTNSLNLLAEIDFAEVSPREEVAYDTSRFTLNYRGSTKLYFDVIGPGYIADAKTRVFVIPPDRSDESSYQTGDKNLLPTDYTTVSFYDCEEDYIIKIAVIEYDMGKGAGDTMYSQNIAVFKGFAKGISRSGEEVPVIKYMQMGQECSIAAKTNGLLSLDSRTWSEYAGMPLSSLKPGDIFQFTADSFGELNEFHVLHVMSQPGPFKERGTTNPTKDFMVGMLSTCYGKVLHKNSEAVIVNGSGMGDTIDHGWDRIYRTAGLSVMIVEQKGSAIRVTKGGKEDIHIGDTVVVRVTNGAAKEIVIYRKDV